MARSSSKHSRACGPSSIATAATSRAPPGTPRISRRTRSRARSSRSASSAPRRRTRARGCFASRRNAWIDQQRRPRGVPGAPRPTRGRVDPRATREAAGTLIAQLAPQERAAVVLKDVFDFSLEEIAEALSTTPGAVKAALHRGRGKLVDEPVGARSACRRRPRSTRSAPRSTRRDLAAVTALLLDTATVEVVGATTEYGKQGNIAWGMLFGSERLAEDSRRRRAVRAGRAADAAAPRGSRAPRRADRARVVRARATASPCARSIASRSTATTSRACATTSSRPTCSPRSAPSSASRSAATATCSRCKDARLMLELYIIRSRPTAGRCCSRSTRPTSPSTPHVVDLGGPGAARRAGRAVAVREVPRAARSRARRGRARVDDHHRVPRAPLSERRARPGARRPRRAGSAIGSSIST